MQASVAFGVAKLLNALISLLQSVEVEVSMVVFLAAWVWGRC
ncbi:hypothetical protein ULF88_25755 [Halopseudomonas pachastrellae]|nr:hypothetical protein [Halopseudomonas pachastrellae]